MVRNGMIASLIAFAWSLADVLLHAWHGIGETPTGKQTLMSALLVWILLEFRDLRSRTEGGE